MAATSTNGKGVNQKSTDTTTITNTTNTNVVQNKTGADAVALASALAGALSAGGGLSGGMHSTSMDPSGVLPGAEVATGGTPTTLPAAGNEFMQQVVIGVVAAVAVSLLVKR